MELVEDRPSRTDGAVESAENLGLFATPTRYEPSRHIQRLAIAPRAEGILDQREITIQSYQTTVPFDREAVEAGLERAWLTPVIRFGVFGRPDGHGLSHSEDYSVAILGLQDDLSVRAYDYANRRPLWYSWTDVVVDTVSIRYFRDGAGLLRFTTTGGGRRITDDRLQEFNSTFLGIPKEAVTKRHFDLIKLRELCFSRFLDHLYMVRFSDPSCAEYKSIDHALFQSRKYIDPDAERLQEVRGDRQAKIESFDSDVSVRLPALAVPAQVRFFIRGLSGSLRLRFPKLTYTSQLVMPEEQAKVFYEIVDATVGLILDDDYYGQQPFSLADLDTDLGMFPDLVDLAVHKSVLLIADERRKFFEGIDLGAPWSQWQPHLRALEELLPIGDVFEHVKALADGLASRDPSHACRLLDQCHRDPKTPSLGDLVARVVAARLHAMPAAIRAHVEESLLAWAIERDRETWDVDPQNGTITAATLCWQRADLSPGALAPVLSTLMGVLHTRLTSSDDDVGSLLARFNWCMAVTKEAFPAPAGLPASLRLVAGDQVPASVGAGASVLKEPVRDLQSLDDAVLEQFGLPLWPSFTASGDRGKITLLNDGVGIAHSVAAAALGTLFGQDGEASTLNLAPGESTVVTVPGKPETLDVRFSKYGRSYRLEVPIAYSKKSPVRPVDTQLRKRGQRDSTIGALKRELHQHILSMKSAIRQADDSGRVFKLPPLRQKDLAKAIGASASAVTRAIKDGSDRELPILLKVVKCVDQIREYRG